MRLVKIEGLSSAGSPYYVLADRGNWLAAYQTALAKLFALEEKEERKETLENWGKAMQRARLAAGLSLEELAEKALVSASTIYVSEHGQHSPTLVNLVALADALHIGLDEYIGREAGP